MKRIGLPVVGQDGPDDAPDCRGADGRRHWRSLEEWSEGAAAAKAEFPRGAAFLPEALTRRGFLQMLGASAALAGVAACRPPRQEIHAYVRHPEQALFPGNPVPYATALARHGHAVGLLVTTVDGRPIKVEGNPDHPESLGASGRLEQATILDLYDPRRIEGFTARKQPKAYRTLLRELATVAATHEKDGGARLRFLTGATGSPLLLDLRRRISERFPRARFHAYESLTEEATADGARLAFGRALDTRLHLDGARIVLALDADFLSDGPSALRLAREFAAHRTPGPDMSRLYVAEAHLSTTGAAADHRFRMKPSEVLGFARQVAAALASSQGLGDLARIAGDAKPTREASAVAEDLARHRGASLVIAGPRQPAAVHAIAHAMNAALGNAGKTVDYAAPPTEEPAGPRQLAALAKDLAAGAVETLVITAWNPVYTAPADVDLEALLTKVPDVLYLAYRPDETSARATWVIGESHPFETWGDARAHDGTVSIVQPLVQPLLESISEVELLAAFLGEAEKGAYQLVQDFWRARSGAGAAFAARWGTWLAKGVVEGTAAKGEAPTVRFADVAGAAGQPPPKAEGLEASFVVDKLDDGRFAENAWLLELPDPITTISWDNAAMVSPRTAQELGVETGTRVELRLRGRKVDAPVFVAPGHADGVVTLPLGWGREAAGPTATNVGFDAGALRGSQAAWIEPGLALAPFGKRKHKLVQTQEHFSMEGRDLALSFDARAWEEEGPKRLEHLRGAVNAMYSPFGYDKQAFKWGMGIDLAKCTGCNGCVVACQAENNIAVVGKAQVARSREMHWLRVDRYFSGPPENPEVVSQPLMCVHCEAAPCEYVCPVNATVHSDEGLNEMVYNRCVGTRYCSNNCPYKVRRFNFLEYQKGKAPLEKLRMNPDVTVRYRGVMEKCTYCVQRIERARIAVRASGQNKIPDGELQTACQQACPSQAIVFGNLADPESRVSKMHQDERRYDLLHFLGTRPRTAYLVRIRNPNPALSA
ncbi:MAG TPA: TAT-variant-translocated molybdopterin oxidoreductase [Anaeromyxobacteraceae bacterium]|nr:TAT-variant-translocated molybdopterin oxidoreductase [Anaeromyxobacteraceae bacterium]